jgi:hypothetical protein
VKRSLSEFYITFAGTNKVMGRLFFILFLLVSFSASHAQNESNPDGDSLVVVTGPDTMQIKSYASRYDPRKALLYAAVVPGLGQIYNKKYWKLPLVYGGFIGLAYGMNFYQTTYLKYKGQLFENIEAGKGNDNDKLTPDGFTTRQLRNQVTRYRRDRDFMVILMGGMYILQVIDAHVDAHLKEFDLNPNLKVSIEPLFEQNSLVGKQTGASLIVRF